MHGNNDIVIAVIFAAQSVTYNHFIFGLFTYSLAMAILYPVHATSAYIIALCEKVYWKFKISICVPWWKCDFLAIFLDVTKSFKFLLSLPENISLNDYHYFVWRRRGRMLAWTCRTFSQFWTNAYLINSWSSVPWPIPYQMEAAVALHNFWVCFFIEFNLPYHSE